MSSSTSLRMLRIASVFYLVTGFVWATAAWAPIEGPGLMMLDMIDWPLDGLPATLDRTSRATSAVGAGVLVGFALLYLLVIAPEIERGNHRVVRGAVIALIAWFIVDSIGSVASGVWSNALLNIPFLLILLMPLLQLRKQDNHHPLDHQSQLSNSSGTTRQ